MDNMGEFPSGQRGQTVNLLAMPSVVRIHLPPPRRRGLHIVRDDFFQKSSLTHSVAPPLQTEPAALGFGLVLAANLKAAVSIVLRCYILCKHYRCEPLKVCYL